MQVSAILAIASLLFLGSAVAQSGPGIYTLQNSTCLYCPEGQYAAASAYNGTVNGCGPGTGIVADLIPEYRFGDCCDGHDQCYGTCGAIKENCDRRFFACMLRTCDEDYPNDSSRNRRCKAVANCYAGAVIEVDVVSCDSFKADHDISGCACVPNTNGDVILPIPVEDDDFAEIPSNPDCSIETLTGLSSSSSSSFALFSFLSLFAAVGIVF